MTDDHQRLRRLAEAAITPNGERIHPDNSECGPRLKAFNDAIEPSTVIALLDLLDAWKESASVHENDRNKREYDLRAQLSTLRGEVDAMEKECERLRKQLRDATCPFDSTAESRRDIRTKERL